LNLVQCDKSLWRNSDMSSYQTLIGTYLQQQQNTEIYANRKTISNGKEVKFNQNIVRGFKA
jgi:hypothetical protein